MKRFLLLLALVFTSLSLLAVNAEAKRFGGGGSIGQQRSMTPQQTQRAPTAAPAPAAAPAPGNKWLGPLAGLAIGAGLGAMFAGTGLGGAMGSILLALAAVALVMFLIAKFRKPQQPAMQYAGTGISGGQPPVQQAYAGGSADGASANARAIPADFPAEAFLRSAKTSFIRLQAANDRQDLDDIREYTTPEMFAEISMQLRERGNVPQRTDVLTINAELLEVNTENNHAIASVRMSGQLRENAGAPENFDEIWHVQKDIRDNQAVWLLSGIQQVG
ncbi:MAG: Tim44-like domain-containing protein [Pseudomonadota bacterium]